MDQKRRKWDLVWKLMCLGSVHNLKIAAVEEENYFLTDGAAGEAAESDKESEVKKVTLYMEYESAEFTG